MPEVDILKNGLDDGRRAATSQPVNVDFALSGNFTPYVELWGAWNFGPVATVEQFSADAALAYAVTPDLQLEAG